MSDEGTESGWRRGGRGSIPWRHVDLVLRAGRSIWLSTTRPDGRPHAAPIWFGWDGREVWFVTGRDTVKRRNLAHQPEVVLQLGDGDEVVIVEGRCRELTDPAELAVRDRAYGDKYVEPVTGARASLAWGVAYAVEVRRIMCWVYGNAGARTDWTPAR